MRDCKIQMCALSMPDSNLCGRHNNLWQASLERQRSLDHEADTSVAFVDFITRVAAEERNDRERLALEKSKGADRG